MLVTGYCAVLSSLHLTCPDTIEASLGCCRNREILNFISFFRFTGSAQADALHLLYRCLLHQLLYLIPLPQTILILCYSPLFYNQVCTVTSSQPARLTLIADIAHYMRRVLCLHVTRHVNTIVMFIYVYYDPRWNAVFHVSTRSWRSLHWRLASVMLILSTVYGSPYYFTNFVLSFDELLLWKKCMLLLASLTA